MYKSLLYTHLLCKHTQRCFQDSIKSEIENDTNYGDAQQAEYPWWAIKHITHTIVWEALLIIWIMGYFYISLESN